MGFGQYSGFGFGAGASGGGSNATIANVIDYGAVGNGVTDDSQAFLDAIASDLPVEVPVGNFLISQSLILNDGQCMFGYGKRSNIVTNTHGSTATLETAYNMFQLFNNCSIWGISFTGDGKVSYTFPWTSQNAIWIQGSNNNVSDCYYTNLKGTGILNVRTDVALTSNNNANGNYFSNCTVGVFTYAGGEYFTFGGNRYYQCSVGINERGANNSHVNFHSTYCAYGLQAVGNGGNSDHSFFSGGTFNHNDVTLQIANLVNGMQFVCCDFYGGPMTVSESVGVIFTGCGFGGATTMAVTATTAKVTLISSSYYQSPFAPTNSGSSAVITQVNILNT